MLLCQELTEQGLAAQMFNGKFMSVGLRIPIMRLYGGSKVSKAYRREELVFTVDNRERDEWSASFLGTENAGCHKSQNGHGGEEKYPCICNKLKLNHPACNQ
jgi:hypothetical protein